MLIKVVGTGCRKCKALLAATEQAVKDSGVQAEIEYVTDMMKIAETGVLRTPGLIINDKIVSSGKVLEAAALAKLIEQSKWLLSFNYLTEGQIVEVLVQDVDNRDRIKLTMKGVEQDAAAE